MNSKIDYANECFNSGFNCAQAVFSAFCEDYGLDRCQALKIACSLGGGIGHLGEVCGAVSGAFLVLGLIYGQNTENETQKKVHTYSLARDFSSRFRKISGSINCTELLEYDLSDEAQLHAARQTDVFKTKCPKYVRNAVEILEEMIAEQKNNK